MELVKVKVKKFAWKNVDFYKSINSNRKSRKIFTIASKSCALATFKRLKF